MLHHQISKKLHERNKADDLYYCKNHTSSKTKEPTYFNLGKINGDIRLHKTSTTQDFLAIAQGPSTKKNQYKS